MRGPRSVEFQDSMSLGSGFESCQQTGEYYIRQMVPPGTVCLKTCSGPGNVDQPETATSSGDFHAPRSRSLGGSLPLPGKHVAMTANQGLDKGLPQQEPNPLSSCQALASVLLHFWSLAQLALGGESLL